MNNSKFLPAKIVHLSEDYINPYCENVRAIMRDKFTADLVDKRITVNDWARWSFVINRLYNTCDTILDVGIAHGTFINSLSGAGFAKRLVGIDIKEYSLYSEINPSFEVKIEDAEYLSFEDNEFETVTCMEVIEHLPGDKLNNVIANLRRVAERKLVISVPFCEPLPLPKWHHQQFTPERIMNIFPNADYTLMLKSPVTRVPWLLVEEEQ